MDMTVLERFEEKFIPVPESGCWIWLAHCNRDGYGKFCLRGHPEQAHRVSYEIYREQIPRGLQVLHHCDVRPCVNPDHLFLGTNADNTNDRIAKDRTAKGESNGRAKLTTKQAAEIRRARGSLREIASAYGISQTVVQYIKKGKIWKDA